MRLLVFSDIHGNITALNQLTEVMENLDFDSAFFLGDLFGYYYDQEACFEIIRKMKNLVWLKGNHDAYAVEAFYDCRKEEDLIRAYGHSYLGLSKRFSSEDIKMIDALPSRFECLQDGRKVGFFHGRPADPLEGRVYADTDDLEEEMEKYDLVFLGHTHCKIDRTIAETRILSPGSLGQPRDGKGYGFLIYDFVTNECKFYNVQVDNHLLRDSIDQHDHGMKKLYDVLEREEHKAIINSRFDDH